MPVAGLQGWHLVIILVLVLLLFGAPKLPQLAKSLGQSMRIFRGEMREMKQEGNAADSSTAPSNNAQQSSAAKNDSDSSTTN
ncbi:Sec-independent protein translocase subunit TatA [Gulosibacter bifidus]|uniref:Sec-independent protein translocase protein TatA n=1 Tax=Gulosibacter bifidus TaxID=272239 RepID=A0ABW5RHJ9_9MICO|nr:Sec-independent protein translocase subunit TatA [Gulosibacter bifidus]